MLARCGRLIGSLRIDDRVRRLVDDFVALRKIPQARRHYGVSLCYDVTAYFEFLTVWCPPPLGKF